MPLPWLAAVCLLVQGGVHPAADSVARYVVTAPAESLRVTVMGPASGTPLVIIPGLISPAFAYRRLLPPLVAAGVQVILIEPLGVGSSARPGGKADYSIAAQAARTGAVLDTLRVASAVVAGHAVGATIALRLAVLRPDLTSRVVLLEVGSLTSAAVPGVKQAIKFSFLIRLFAGRGRVKKELRKGLIANSVDSGWVSDSVIEGYTAGAAGDLGAVLRALKRMDQSVEPDSLVPRLAEVRVPVRLIVGGGARLGGGRSAGRGRIRQLREGMPQLVVDTIPGAGLHIQEEQPEALVRALLHEVREPRP
jgi:pimeloyl-ACP methyl ester carboxylesterase